MQKGQTVLWIVIGVLVIAIIAGGAYYFGYDHGWEKSTKNSEKSVCTMEAKICPDGSGVGRVGPNCEFAECPVDASGAPNGDAETANWKTYTNSKYGFQIKYPKIIKKYNEDWMYEENKTFDGSIDIIGFGTPLSKQGGYIWGIEVHSGKNIEKLITVQGSQFSDRKESRKNRIINGKLALLVTVTTDQVKDWISKRIYIEKDDLIFVISNGAVDIIEFDSFYNTFKFLK